MNQIKEIWDRIYVGMEGWWAKSLPLIFAMILMFLIGQAIGVKGIVEDCKLMGVFKDGPYVYNCNPRGR